ncbi:unnamed protein product [Hymenolepis diminuta]|uniref:Uncharacterized protein n=1 Tax=Hymenolepis diminuta TaxID=6216 RepID=A0A564YNH1_HYMDI|nr:unnamed protein product [Hymenolepis diminuta]
MESQNFMNLEGKNTTKKRKFTPNITKALAKKSNAGGSNFNDYNRKSQESVRKPNTKRSRINRKALDSDEPRFVQGFSIFEAGLGCAEKGDRVHLERNSLPSRNNRISSKTIAESGIHTEVQSLDNDYPTVSNVHQVFKYPPNVMPPDPPDVSAQFKRAPFSSGGPTGDSQSSLRSSTSLVHELFDESKPNGSLFSLRIPDALLYEGSPLEKSGKFGKIQILDSGETRLIIGDCFFRLTSPGLAPYSTIFAIHGDISIIEEKTLY